MSCNKKSLKMVTFFKNRLYQRGKLHVLFHTLAIRLNRACEWTRFMTMISTSFDRSQSHKNFLNWNLRLCFSTMKGSILPRRAVVDVIVCALSYTYKDFNGASSWLWSRVPTGIRSPRTALHKYKTLLCTPCRCKYGYWYFGFFIW